VRRAPGGSFVSCGDNEWFSQLSMGQLDVYPIGSAGCIIYSHYKDWLYLGCGLWTPVGHMTLGYDGFNESRDANFLMLLTCHGGEYCSWEGGGWDLVAANGSMNMILGFHGGFLAYDDALENFDTFMANSCCSHAGNRWVENLMSQDGNCAIVMGWGKSHSAIEWPIYNYQAFLNFKDRRPPTYSHYYFKEGCDPTGEISDLPDESPAQ